MYGQSHVPGNWLTRNCPRLRLDSWPCTDGSAPGVSRRPLEMPDHTNPELRTFTGHAIKRQSNQPSGNLPREVISRMASFILDHSVSGHWWLVSSAWHQAAARKGQGTMLVSAPDLPAWTGNETGECARLTLKGEAEFCKRALQEGPLQKTGDITVGHSPRWNWSSARLLVRTGCALDALVKFIAHMMWARGNSARASSSSEKETSWL